MEGNLGCARLAQTRSGNGNFWSIDPTNSDGQIDFLTPQTGLSFLWGSPDVYNRLFVELNNDSVNLVTVPAFATSGDNNDSSYFALNATGGDLITGLTFRSVRLAGYSFEVDNLRISAIPEPQTYALLFAGLGAVGFIARRRRTRA